MQSTDSICHLKLSRLQFVVAPTAQCALAQNMFTALAFGQWRTDLAGGIPSLGTVEDIDIFRALSILVEDQPAMQGNVPIRQSFATEALISHGEKRGT